MAPRRTPLAATAGEPTDGARAEAHRAAVGQRPSDPVIRSSSRPGRTGNSVVDRDAVGASHDRANFDETAIGGSRVWGVQP